MTAPNFTGFTNEALKQIREQEAYLKKVMQAAKKLEEATEEYKKLVDLGLGNKNNHTTTENNNENNDNEEHNILDGEETYSGEQSSSIDSEFETESNTTEENISKPKESSQELPEISENNSIEETNETPEEEEEITQGPKINLGSLLKDKKQDSED